MRLTITALFLGCGALIISSSATARRVHEGRYAHIPKYTHIFVIVEENKDFSQIMNPDIAPNITRLARENGSAEDFFG